MPRPTPRKKWASSGFSALAPETVYFAALRRYLALIDIELGDASEADVAYILRGAGFSARFDVRDMPRIITQLAGNLGLDAPAETYVPELRNWRYPTGDSRKIRVRDLLSGESYQWHNEWNYVELHPYRMPAHIFKVEPL